MSCNCNSFKSYLPGSIKRKKVDPEKEMEKMLKEKTTKVKNLKTFGNHTCFTTCGSMS